jgi:quinol monooxygenase YgiN
MVIVAGHIAVEPQQRESYLAGCVSIVERARGAAGCLDFAITVDLIDPGRVNLFERWESQAAVKNFRSSAPSNKQRAAMLSTSVAEYDIADARPCSGNAQHEPAARTVPRPMRSVRRSGRIEGRPNQRACTHQ